MKLNSSGTGINLDANDLVKNRIYFFKYDLATTTWFWIAATAGDQLNIPGTSGNLATITTGGALLGTLTQSLMISQTTHSATGKSTPIDTDELPLVDTASSNVLKKVTWAQVKTTFGGSLGAIIAAATSKVTPIGADLFVIADSASSNATKSVSITNLFATFGTLIAASTAKTTATAADRVLISDASADATKKMALSDLMGVINVLTAKTTPVAADLISIYDSVALAAKSLSFTNLVAYLKTAIATDTLAAPTDITTNNATTSFHGFLKKLSGGTADTMRGDGTWGGIYAPEGFLQNGVITPTVSSNNLTVAIKTLSGGNPSATDPVYIRINGVIRSITSSLSVTINAGTNWFNSGSSELATNEIDYFTYLGYNSGTSAVVIGFARIPFGKQYSSFSATTTNEQYCAISNITTIASTDYFEVIGRFAATLSATASFNWSVPTFTASNLVNYPIYNTRSLTWTPTIAYSGGTTNPTSNTPSAAIYYLNERRVGSEIVSALVIGSGNRTVTTFTTPFLPPRITPIACIDTITAASTKFPTYAFANVTGIFQLSETMANSGSYYINATFLL